MSNFINKITATLDNLDWLELNVRTFTGDLKGIVKSDDNKWETLIDTAQKAGTIELVAMTRGKLDGDIDQFIMKSPKPALLEAHNAAVESAQRTRKAIVDFVLKGVKGE